MKNMKRSLPFQSRRGRDATELATKLRLVLQGSWSNRHTKHGGLTGSEEVLPRAPSSLQPKLYTDPAAERKRTCTAPTALSQTNALPVQGFRKRWLLALSHIITQIQLIALATSMNNDTGCSETGQLCQLLRLGAGNCISCSSSEGLCLASEAEVDSTRDLPPAKLPDMPEPPDCVKPQSTASPPETKACRLPASQTQQKSQKRG